MLKRIREGAGGKVQMQELIGINTSLLDTLNLRSALDTQVGILRSLSVNKVEVGESLGL